MSNSTNRIVERLADARRAGRGALLPYFTAGLPDIGTTIELIRSADAAGAAAVEVGFPYSDSIADGPVIQESFYQALDAGHRVEAALSAVSAVRGDVRCGLIAMVSHSIVYRRGVERFAADAAQAGFDGLIVPDVPVEESAPIAAAARSASLCHIGLVAPTTTPARRSAIAQASTGFVYQIAVAGTTGERDQLPAELPEQVAALRAAAGLPVCVGFGVSRAEHVRAVCAVADGAIVGSALVRRVQAAAEQGLRGRAVAEAVEPFLHDLMQGTQP